MSGLSCDIYRSDYDSTCNACQGVKRVILTGPGVHGPWTDDDLNKTDMPVLKLVKRFISGRIYLHAEPVASCPSDMVGWMSGGTFIYSHDSRFPSDYPIALHDRCETQKQYQSLSN